MCCSVEGQSIHDLVSGRDITGCVVGEICHRFGFEANEALILVEEWLTASGQTSGFDELIRRSMPGIVALEQHVGPIALPINISPRLQRALQHSDAHSAAVAYTSVPVGSRAALAFAKSLVISDHEQHSLRLTESRAAFLPLVSDSGLWSELATVDVPEHTVIPPTRISSITAALEPRQQVNFAMLAMRHLHGGSIITAATQLGISATPEISFAQLIATVRLTGCDVGNSLLDDVSANATDGYRVDVLRTPNEVYQLGEAAKNCLAEREDHGWQWSVGIGEVELGAFYLHEELVAIIALDTQSHVPLEFLAPRNVRVDTTVASEIATMLVANSEHHCVPNEVLCAFRNLANSEFTNFCEDCCADLQ